jgi:ferric-dicitrate binding protein FerR (iron transport regulator)
LVEKVNRSGKPLELHLIDGSRVILQNDSRISYAPQFVGAVREVYLSGEAFFEVVKDPARPFVVHANELVTKVLGTSFTIKAYETEEQVSVEVRTGKVSVALDSDAKIRQKATHRELEGVVLTPNQKIVFSRLDIRMTKLLVAQPVVTALAPAAFNFEDTPATEVFAALEKAYSVDIVYDEDLWRRCPLTAAFTNEPLFEKLNTICKAIEAEYEVIDGQIVVYGKGCNN